LVFVSQPFAPLESQLPYPAAQPGVQTELEQVFEVVCAFVVHTVPQAPQFAAVLVRFTSQPLAPLPSQLPNPALHTTVHAPVPAVQVAVPFVPVHAPVQQLVWQSFPTPQTRHPATLQSLGAHATPAALMTAQALPDVQ
jgi:hypothetical protein